MARLPITDSFTYRLLLVASNEKSADSINVYFEKAGLPVMDVETSITNVIAKLKNPDYDGCVLEAGVSPDISMFIEKIRQSNHGAQIPLIIIASDANETDCKRMYEAGANFVISNILNERIANEVCWMLSSLIEFVGQFKALVERFVR
jgi:DNA-binding response OmpR family regulator